MALFRHSLIAAGTSLGPLGVAVQEVQGWSDGVLQALTLAGIPRRGGTLISRREENGGRPYRVVATYLADTLAGRQSGMDQIKALLEAGPIIVERATFPGRRSIGFLAGKINVTEFKPIRSACQFEFPMLGISSYLEDTMPRTVNVGTTPTAMVLGTAPVAPLLLAPGPFTNLVVKLRNAAGLLLSACTFTVTTLATDYLLIDCAKYAITKSVSGVLSSVYSIYSGDNLPILDPADGDPTNASYPTLEATTPVLALYARNWR